MSCFTISVSVSRVTIPTMRSKARKRIEISVSSIHERIKSWWSETRSAWVEVIFASARSPTYFTLCQIQNSRRRIRF